MDWELIQRLMSCFPRSFINYNGEFIAHQEANVYFNLMNCKGELEIKCKVLEWFSRSTWKAEPYRTKQKNDEFHKFMLDGINEFLGTELTKDDMEWIYIYLGNSINRPLTIMFINSGYDVNVLKER